MGSRASSRATHADQNIPDPSAISPGSGRAQVDRVGGLIAAENSTRGQDHDDHRRTRDGTLIAARRRSITMVPMRCEQSG